MGLFKGKQRKKVEDLQGQPSAAPVDAPQKPKPRRRISISTIIMILLLLGGAGIIAYPTFADWWNSYHQSRAIAVYASKVESTDPQVIAAMLEEARAYNASLVNESNRFLPTPEKSAEYKRLLDPTGQGIMGYVQVPSIRISYPIYHGVDDTVLQIAAGHIEGTSLPVGGPTTHCAISGHRGLPSAKLFTDLDKLTEGDVFTITVLKDTLTYEVDQIRIVDPSDMKDLQIEQDKDYLTLVTCTPYGINTHRMLVRGHRIANITGTAAIPPEAVQIPNYVAVPAVAIPMLFIYLLSSVIYYYLRRDGYDHDLVMEELENMKAKESKTTEPTNANTGSDDAESEKQ